MMPQYLITAPDGTKYNVTAPDGASEQDALARVQQEHTTAAPRPEESTGARVFKGVVGAEGSYLKGAAEGAVGAPMSLVEGAANLEQTGIHDVRKLAGSDEPSPAPVTMPGSTRWLEQHFKTPGTVDWAEKIGEFAGGAESVTRGAQAAKEMPRVAGDLAPGATGRAQAQVAKVGDAALPSAQGKNLQTAILSNLNGMDQAKSDAFEAAMKARGIDPFGKDPSVLTKAIFKNQGTVNLFKRMDPSNPDWIERPAASYAASELDRLTGAAERGMVPGTRAQNMANAVAKWKNDPKNADWLSATPATQAAVNEYLQYLQRTAATQKAGAAVAGAATFFAGGGSMSWLRHLW